MVVEGIIVATIAALPPTIAALRASSETKKVAAQLQPNGGGSVRDAVDRVERKVDDLRREVNADRERQDHLAARVDEGLREHVTFRDKISEALHLHTRCS